MTGPKDTPGVIAPPPLIYLGFLLVGWGLAELGARPEAVDDDQAGNQAREGRRTVHADGEADIGQGETEIDRVAAEAVRAFVDQDRRGFPRLDRRAPTTEQARGHAIQQQTADLDAGNTGWTTGVLNTHYTQTVTSNGDGTETVSITLTGAVGARKFARVSVTY